MKYRELGSTGIKVSEIGFGAWAIGGTGYGDTDDRESKKALHKGLDLGVTLIDTADSYGKGHSESLIGEVLTDRNDNETVICTKVGWDFYSGKGIKSNLKPEYIKFAVQNSLTRIKRDSVDIYLLHSPNPQNLINSSARDTLSKLQKEGLIKYYGVSISDYHFDATFDILDDLCPQVVEVKLNLLEGAVNKVFFDYCKQNGIGVIAREPLANGLLSGKYNEKSSFAKNDHRNGFKKEFLQNLIKSVNLLEGYFGSKDEMKRSAIRYPLEYDVVSAVIPGAKTEKQVIQNISSAESNFDLIEFENYKMNNLV